MNAPVTVQATEVAQIEAALDALLTFAIKADRDPCLFPHKGPQAFGALIGATLDRLATWTRAQQAAADLLARPMWELSRQGVTKLGERLHEIGGLTLMREVCDRVAAMDPNQWGRRTDIMDKRWDGIGHTDESPGWCC